MRPRPGARAEELGLKIGTYPTALLSPVSGGIKAGLAALQAGEAEAPMAPTPPEFRAELGYADTTPWPAKFAPPAEPSRV